jgi:hypothetical protein
MFASITLKFRGDDDECTEQHGPIIVSQFNQPRLLHQTAEFDQMPGAFASRHNPFPHVSAALAGFNAVRHCLGSLDRSQCQLEFRD